MTFARAADRLAWPVDAARPEAGTTDGEVTGLVAMVNAVTYPQEPAAAENCPQEEAATRLQLSGAPPTMPLP
jgi:hypothetical protein